MADLFGVPMSVGTISHLEQTTSRVVAEAVQEAHASVAAQAVAHVDETSWRQGGKRAWLWVAVTSLVTVFVVRMSRGSQVRAEVQRLLEVGSVCGVAKTAGTCREILKRREALWTFVQVDGVEPTNNAAERAIRPGVQRRKLSFGTQSEAGSRFVERIMTVVATLHQQQRHVLEYLTAAHEAALRGEPAPSLLPARDLESHAAA
jgi:transposase-like protein